LAAGGVAELPDPDREPGPWPVEDVPDEHVLYFRVLWEDVSEDEEGEERPNPGAFRDNPETGPDAAMSTDWSKYSTPQKCQERVLRIERITRAHTEWGVVSLRVARVRDIVPRQDVRHNPVYNNPEQPNNPNNRSHTDVKGPKKEPGVRNGKTRIRNLFQDIAVWEIRPVRPVPTSRQPRDAV
jgi:hypothetical protein